MKVKLQESDHGTYIKLEPENLQETAHLLRMVKSAKKETPQVSVYFPADGKIEGSISFRKIRVSTQENFISLRSRRK